MIFGGVYGGEEVKLGHGTDVIWIDIQGIVRVWARGTSTNISAGVINEYVNMTAYFQSLAHGFFSVHRIGQISGKKGGPMAMSTNLLYHRWSGRCFYELRRSALVHIVNDHISTGPGKVQGIMTTQPPAGSGYQRYFSPQIY